MITRRSFLSSFFAAATPAAVLSTPIAKPSPKPWEDYDAMANEVMKYGYALSPAEQPPAAHFLLIASVPYSFYMRRAAVNLPTPRLPDLHHSETNMIYQIMQRVWAVEQRQLKAAGFRHTVMPHPKYGDYKAFITSPNFTCDVFELDQHKWAHMLWAPHGVAQRAICELVELKADYPTKVVACADYGNLEVYPDRTGAGFSLFCRVPMRCILK